jgi:hypothetical protein
MASGTGQICAWARPRWARARRRLLCRVGGASGLLPHPSASAASSSADDPACSDLLPPFPVPGGRGSAASTLLCSPSTLVVSRARPRWGRASALADERQTAIFSGWKSSRYFSVTFTGRRCNVFDTLSLL